MSESTTEQAATTEANASEGDGTRVFSQEQVNSLLADQKRRVQSQFTDYADLKAKAEAHDAALEAARTDQEKAVDAARKEGETAALDRANVRLVSAEARALAAEAKFRNPNLAVRALDLTGIKVNEDGSVDAEAVKAKLKELSDAEPYLVDDGKGNRPKPDHSQGNSGSSQNQRGGSVAEVMAQRAAARDARNKT